MTTNITIDTGATSFSVLIPAIAVKSITDQETFASEVVVTTHSGPNSFPLTGVHEKYQFIPLQGTASFVLTLLEPLLAALSEMSKT